MSTEKKVYRTQETVQQPKIDQAGANISWRAVIAGVVTFLALNILSLLIGSAIGFGVPDLTSANPLQGVGTGLLWWMILSLIVSMAAGGFVTGLMANRLGFAHGFLSWASSIIIGFVMLTMLVGRALGFAGNVAGTALDAAGNVVGSAADAVGTLTQESFDAISNNIHIDTEQLNAEVANALENTDIEVLQPDFLQTQVEDTVSDITDAAYNVVVEGRDPQTEIENVTSNIEDRLAVIDEGVDYEALRSEIAANAELSEEEIDQAVSNIESAWNEVSQQANDVFNEASQALDRLVAQASEGASQVAEGVAETSEDVTNEASKYSLYLFFALLAGLFITGFAGEAGVKVAHEVIN